jgi:transposase
MCGKVRLFEPTLEMGVMSEVRTIGLDLSKTVLQVHGADASGAVVFRKQLRRRQVLEFIDRQPHCLVAMEACGSCHFSARKIGRLGHDPSGLCQAFRPATTFDGGKQRLGSTTKMGEQSLRRLLIMGANSVIVWRARKGAAPQRRRWAQCSAVGCVRAKVHARNPPVSL